MQRWKKFEYRIRDFLHKNGFEAERVPLSGASRAVKGDIVAQRGNLKLRIDAKSTKSKSAIKIERGSLEKIAQEAEEDEIPLLVFSFYRHRKLYAILDSRAHREAEGKKKTWARDTVMLRKEEVLEAPLSLEFRGDSKPYTIVELEDLLGDGE